MNAIICMVSAALVVMPEGGSGTVMVDDMLHPVIIGAPGSVATDWFDGTWSEARVSVKESKLVDYQIHWSQ